MSAPSAKIAARLAGELQTQGLAEAQQERYWSEEQGSRDESGSRSSSSDGFVYDGVRAGRALRAGLSRRSAYGRALPMEEVCFYIKRIDNSQLRRPSDPKDRRTWTKSVAPGLAMLFLAALCFGPRAWLRNNGYRLAELSEQRQELAEIEAHLRVRHAQLSDLRRVSLVAASMGLESPEASRYAWESTPVATGASGATLASLEPSDLSRP